MKTTFDSIEIPNTFDMSGIETYAEQTFGLKFPNGLRNSFRVNILYKEIYYHNATIECYRNLLRKLALIVDDEKFKEQARNFLDTKDSYDDMKVDITIGHFGSHVFRTYNGSDCDWYKVKWYIDFVIRKINEMIWKNHGDDLSNFYYDFCCDLYSALNIEHMLHYQKISGKDYSFSVDMVPTFVELERTAKEMEIVSKLCVRTTNREPIIKMFDN